MYQIFAIKCLGSVNIKTLRIRYGYTYIEEFIKNRISANELCALKKVFREF